MGRLAVRENFWNDVNSAFFKHCKGRWYYQLLKFQTQLPRISTVSNQNQTNQRGHQGCRPMKLKLSARDSVKLNFSQCKLKLPRHETVNRPGQKKLSIQIWIESENFPLTNWQKLSDILSLISVPTFHSNDLLFPLLWKHWYFFKNFPQWILHRSIAHTYFLDQSNDNVNSILIKSIFLYVLKLGCHAWRLIFIHFVPAEMPSHILVSIFVHMYHSQAKSKCAALVCKTAPTPWLARLLVLRKISVNQKLC